MDIGKAPPPRPGRDSPLRGEKQGQFFIGQQAGEGGEALLYDSADLTTHGVIVGMTGSGKTGLDHDARRGTAQRHPLSARSTESAEQAKDEAIAKLKDKFQARLERAHTVLSKAENRVADLEATAGSKQTEELLSGAGELIGVLFGGRKRSNPLGGAARRRSASSQARARAENAKAALEEDMAELAELEADLQDEVADLDDEFAAQAETVEEVEIPLEKTDIRVVELKLVWVPTS